MIDKTSPDSLKYQWRILGHVLRSGWATSLDKSIAFEIVDNYVKRHGNSRASLSYLVKATGADRKSVIASTRRLVEHGPFSVARQGVGTRPTEYVIHFEKVQDSSSSGADTTTSSEHASSGVDTTTGGGVDTTTSASSSGADTTESVLHVAAYKAGVHDRMIEPAPPTAPLSVGLSATDAGSAGGGFEELWKAYGHRQKKADAKAAYTKADPDADMHERMVAAAKAWFAAWAAQDKAEAPRFTLAKWIEREEYECDPPTAFKPKERKAKAEHAPAASNDNELEDGGRMVCDVGPFTNFGTFQATIIGSKVEEPDELTQKVTLDLSWSNPGFGPDAQHVLYYRHPDQALQMRGRIVSAQFPAR